MSEFQDDPVVSWSSNATIGAITRIQTRSVQSP